MNANRDASPQELVAVVRKLVNSGQMSTDDVIKVTAQVMQVATMGVEQGARVIGQMVEILENWGDGPFSYREYVSRGISMNLEALQGRIIREASAL